MNGGKRRPGFAKNGLGYTIIEVMIVLAVSGVMFIIAANFISGKQGRTQFTEGTNELASMLQDTIEGVTDGQYTDINLHCVFTPGPPASTTISAATSADKQGNQAPCVFLGKVLHFSEQVPGETAAEQYQTLSIAGGRVKADNTPITTLSEAGPTVIDDLTTAETVPQRLDISEIKINGGTTIPDSYGIGFLQGLGTTDGTGGLANGAQAVGLYYVSGLGPNQPTIFASTHKISGSTLVPAQTIDICVNDGTRYATITLGQNNNQLSVNVDNHGETNTC